MRPSSLVASSNVTDIIPNLVPLEKTNKPKPNHFTEVKMEGKPSFTEKYHTKFCKLLPIFFTNFHSLSCTVRQKSLSSSWRCRAHEWIILQFAKRYTLLNLAGIPSHKKAKSPLDETRKPGHTIPSFLTDLFLLVLMWKRSFIDLKVHVKYV